jgi:hypothetical protein
MKTICCAKAAPRNGLARICRLTELRASGRCATENLNLSTAAMHTRSLERVRLCKLFPTPAEALDPLFAHCGKIGWVSVGLFSGDEIIRPEFQPCVVLPEIR